MKKTGIILLLAACSLAACKMDDKKAGAEIKRYDNGKGGDSSAVTSIQWLDSTFSDLGKTMEGEIIEVSYRFKNSGDKNLWIENVSASCGCTIPEKPEKAFAPGEEGVIKAKFDSQGKPGTQSKYVTVTANTPEKNYTLTFKVEVAPKAK